MGTRITVNKLERILTVGLATGTLLSCSGSDSQTNPEPEIEQYQSHQTNSSGQTYFEDDEFNVIVTAYDDSTNSPISDLYVGYLPDHNMLFAVDPQSRYFPEFAPLIHESTNTVRKHEPNRSDNGIEDIFLDMYFTLIEYATEYIFDFNISLEQATSVLNFIGEFYSSENACTGFNILDYNLTVSNEEVPELIEDALITGLFLGESAVGDGSGTFSTFVAIGLDLVGFSDMLNQAYGPRNWDKYTLGLNFPLFSIGFPIFIHTNPPVVSSINSQISENNVTLTAFGSDTTIYAYNLFGGLLPFNRPDLTAACLGETGEADVDYRFFVTRQGSGDTLERMVSFPNFSQVNVEFSGLPDGYYLAGVEARDETNFNFDFGFGSFSINTEPISNGKIAFYSYRDGNYDIYVMNADGSNQTRLTSDPAIDKNPTSWSPDGSMIAFCSERDGNSEIYTMNADGSNQTRLTYDPDDDLDPSSWSPDGTMIAFCSMRDGDSEVYIMNADGSNQTNLTNNSASDINPSWNPDGSRIAFNSTRDDYSEIYIMNTDGSNQTRLTNNQTEGTGEYDPVWNSDGGRIAFCSERDGNHEIYVMNADGSNQTNLTNNSADDINPYWSPDGSMIVFNSNRSGNYEIYTMNADGSNQTNISNSSANDLEPSWGPE